MAVFIYIIGPTKYLAIWKTCGKTDLCGPNGNLQACLVNLPRQLGLRFGSSEDSILKVQQAPGQSVCISMYKNRFSLGLCWLLDLSFFIHYSYSSLSWLSLTDLTILQWPTAGTCGCTALGSSLVWKCETVKLDLYLAGHRCCAPQIADPQVPRELLSDLLWACRAAVFSVWCGVRVWWTSHYTSLDIFQTLRGY